MVGVSVYANQNVEKLIDKLNVKNLFDNQNVKKLFDNQNVKKLFDNQNVEKLIDKINVEKLFDNQNISLLSQKPSFMDEMVIASKNLFNKEDSHVYSTITSFSDVDFKNQLNDYLSPLRTDLKPVLTEFTEIKMKVLREEVPFERFVGSYTNTLTAKSSKADLWKARAVSFGHLLEGSLQTVAHSVAFLVKKVFESMLSCSFTIKSARHREVAKTQLVALKYSFKAILDPFKTVNKIDKDPNVGIEESKREWGTNYNGKRTFYFWGSYDRAK